MSFVVFNKVTLNTLKMKNGGKVFATEKSAKSNLTKAINNNQITDIENWVIGTIEDYRNSDYEIEVTSAFDGKTKVKIMRSEKGSCTDPSTERYWTM